MARLPSSVVVAAFFASLGCQSPSLLPQARRASTAPKSASASKQSLNPLAKLERSLVFAPSPYPEGDWQPAGLAFEDARFTPADGTQLHGWYVPHERPRAIVLYSHGNGGNVALWADVLRKLHDRLQVSALVYDYRGYGRSQGEPSEAGVLADARAARAWLAQRAGVPEGEIVFMGRSLGGAVAIDLAAADGARGLVVESTFTSLPEVGQKALPFSPVSALMQTRFNSLAKIDNYHGPLLASHGTVDRLIPYEMGQQLFDAANEPKQFVAIADGDHNDPQSEEYYDALSAFLDRLPTNTR